MKANTLKGIRRIEMFIWIFIIIIISSSGGISINIIIMIMNVVTVIMSTSDTRKEPLMIRMSADSPKPKRLQTKAFYQQF